MVSVVFTMSEMLMIRGLWLPHVFNELCVLFGKWSFAIYLVHCHPWWMKNGGYDGFYRRFFRIWELGNAAETGIGKLRIVLTTGIVVMTIDCCREWLFGMAEKGEQALRGSARWAWGFAKDVVRKCREPAKEEQEEAAPTDKLDIVPDPE
jgi:hypothetical protein